ncbi:MAG: DNA repair protein RadC [Salibacteraceae bacterium]
MSLFYFHPFSMGTTADDKLSIKAWAEDDRPREKMLLKGRGVLTNAELIAILIASGTREESAVDLAKRILSSVGNDLGKLGKLSVSDLMKFRGIGKAKAISISAALELGRRRSASSEVQDEQITSSKASFKLLYPLLADLDHEQFIVVLLRRNNTLIETVRVSQGGVSGTIVDAKLVFKPAIEKLASCIILAHNHPSGNLTPSQSDIRLTKSLVEMGSILEISVLDHIIVAGDKYTSFADSGLI